MKVFMKELKRKDMKQLLSGHRKAHRTAELWEKSSWRKAADGSAALETPLRRVRKSDTQTIQLKDKNVNTHYHLGAAASNTFGMSSGDFKVVIFRELTPKVTWLVDNVDQQHCTREW